MADLERARAQRKLTLLAIAVVFLLGMTASWVWSPMRDWLDLNQAILALQRGARVWGPGWGSVLVFAALVAAIPLTFVTVVTLLAFGPSVGLAVSLLGACAAALVTFEIGKKMGHDAVVRLGGARINLVSQKLAKRGLLSVIAIRMVPAAPFAIVNMLVGTSHIKRWQMLVGTALGMLPGALVMALFVDRIAASLLAPAVGPSWIVAVAAAALIAAAAWLFRRWLRS